MLRMCGFSNSPKLSKLHKLPLINFIVKIVSVAKTIYSISHFFLLWILCSMSRILFYFCFSFQPRHFFFLQQRRLFFFKSQGYIHTCAQNGKHCSGQCEWFRLFPLGVYNPLKITTTSVSGLITCHQNFWRGTVIN